MQRLLVASGAWRVRRNLVLVDGSGNRSQVDLSYGLLRPVLVECKNYGASGRPVPLEDAAKFKEVLRLHGFAPSRGLLVTTSTFSPRALTAGLRTVDGAQLAAWEARVRARARARWAAAAALAAAAAAAAAAASADADAARGAVAWLQAALRAR